MGVEDKSCDFPDIFFYFLFSIFSFFFLFSSTKGSPVAFLRTSQRFRLLIGLKKLKSACACQEQTDLAKHGRKPDDSGRHHPLSSRHDNDDKQNDKKKSSVCGLQLQRKP